MKEREERVVTYVDDLKPLPHHFHALGFTKRVADVLLDLLP